MREGEQRQRQYLQALRTSRAAASRSQVFPYFRYVAQSGFGLLLAATGFAAMIGYGTLLLDIPGNLQVGLIGAVLIACAAVWTPLRTYMQPADTVFSLPLESAVIRHYIRPSLHVAIGLAVLRVLAVFGLLTPLYLKAPMTAETAQARSLWLAGLLLALVAAWNVGGGWAERRMTGGLARAIARTARILASLLFTWALLNGPFVPAVAFTACGMLLAALLWRTARTVRLPWERLMQEEARTVRRWRRFLSWFVDMPTEETRPARRSWAAWLGDRLPWERKWAWHYWYAKTFARGETFGAWLRWLLVVAAILLIADHPVADWIGYAIGFAVGGIQLTELAGIRHDASVRTLPAGPDRRGPAAAAVARAAGLAGTVLLWLAAASPQGAVPMLSWTSLALLAAGIFWNGWLIPRRIARPRDEDDD